MKKIIFTLLISCLGVSVTNANNIEVTNITLENLNEGAGWVQVEFDLSWENSWRLSVGPANWDAAWVFVKYRANSGDWQHAMLNAANVVAPAGSEVLVSPDGMGAMVQRDSDGNGDLNLQDVRVRWDFGTVSTSDVLDVQVFAIEMVYVPEGAHSVGGTTGDEVGKFHEGGSPTTSYQITSESAITIANSAGNLFYDNSEVGSDSGDQLGSLTASWPKGYGAFYCMKYETSQAQWVAFFNTLTAAQKITRDITGPNGKNSDAEVIRNAVSWADGTTSATTTNPDVGINFVNVADQIAYADWSGLRPITELEYEKACRGPIAPKPGEFAWGNANITATPYIIVNAGQPNEQVSNPATGTGNVSYSGSDGDIDGPVRNGIFAASAINKNREETGGSYYGIMELTGSLYERCVTVGTVRGRSFDGSHGDGVLASNGESNVSNWPNSVTGDGIGYKAGSYINGQAFLRVSDRYDAANAISSGNSRLGFRLGRTGF